MECQGTWLFLGNHEEVSWIQRAAQLGPELLHLMKDVKQSRAKPEVVDVHHHRLFVRLHGANRQWLPSSPFMRLLYRPGCSGKRSSGSHSLHYSWH